MPGSHSFRILSTILYNIIQQASISIKLFDSMSLPPTQSIDIPGPAGPRYRKKSLTSSPAESGPSDTVDFASTSQEYLDPQKDM